MRNVAPALLLVILLAVGALIYRVWVVPAGPGSGGPVVVGQTAPDADSRSLDGRPWSLQSQRGKVVLLDFWATYCGPCLEAMPEMRRLHEQFKSHPDFVMASISVDPDVADLQAFLDRQPAPAGVLLHEGSGGGLASAFGVNMIPTVILIDRDGTVIGVDLPHESLVGKLRELLK